MRTERDAQAADIFIRAMKRSRTSAQSRQRAKSAETIHVPPIGEAVAWLRREKETLGRCLEVIRAHPLLIYDDSMNCLWDFLQPLLKECAKNPHNKQGPVKAFMASPSLGTTEHHTNNWISPLTSDSDLPHPTASPTRASPSGLNTRIPVRSPNPPHRHRVIKLEAGRPADRKAAPDIKSRPVLPPIGLGSRMGRRRSSSTTDLAILGKISEGQAFPFMDGALGSSRVKPPGKTSSADDISEMLDDTSFIKTTYVVYHSKEEPQVVHFPGETRRDSIFKYLDSDSELSYPLEATFSDLDRRTSTSSDFSGW